MLQIISADGYLSFAIFAIVISDGSDDGDDDNSDDGDDPSPSCRNHRSDGDDDGTGLRTGSQWMTAQ